MRSRNGKDLDFVDEEMPEWLDDGPSSMNDMVELKGFEDDLGTVGEYTNDKMYPIKSKHNIK
jgi:hypothetical protein